MANLDAPRGLKLFQMEGKTVRIREYEKTAGEAFFAGDLLMRIPAGTVQVYIAGTAPAAGIVVGVVSESSLATDTKKVAVIDDPEATFICQSADAYAEADNGQNVDIAAAPVANAALSRSGQELDLATKAVTATLPLKIIGLAPRINDAPNDAGVNADILVKLNSVERAAGSTGI